MCEHLTDVSSLLADCLSNVSRPPAKLEFSASTAYAHLTYDTTGQAVSKDHSPPLNARLQKLEFSGSTAYVQLTYDAAGRLWALKDTRLPVADLGGDTFYYEYDDNNRPTIITYPDGETIVYSYDAAGRRTSMTAPGTGTQFL